MGDSGPGRGEAGERVPRVALVAYACEPGRGSEPGAGWSWALGWARRGPVTVLTRANNRAAIESWAGWSDWEGERPDFAYYDLPAFARFWKRGGTGVHLYHYLWQLGAGGVLRRLRREGRADAVQHVTFGAYWYPSAAAFSGAPYVLGPVGGAEVTARELLGPFFSLRGRIGERVRTLAQRTFELDPMVRATVRRAGVVLATTRETADRVRRLGAREVRIMPHVGDRREGGMAPTATQPADGPLRVLMVARLIEWKGVQIGLRAIASMSHRPVRCVVLGDGPERKRLRDLATAIGVSDEVEFVRRLEDYADVLRLYADSDVFVHLATHESGGMAVAEAMAAGLPCVVLDIGGPAMLVDETCGFVLPPDGSVVESAAGALDALAADARARARMGERARRRVSADFSWDERVREAAALCDAVYRNATGREADTG